MTKPTESQSMTLQQRLEKIRDEKAYNYGEAHAPWDQNVNYDLHFGRGFDAAVSELLPIVEAAINHMQNIIKESDRETDAYIKAREFLKMVNHEFK